VAREPPERELDRVDLTLEHLDHEQRDRDPFPRVDGEVRAL
jgi:hypothetical protein